MYIFIDVETNGIGTFRPPTQIITQISFIKTDLDGNILQNFSKLIKGAKDVADIKEVVFTVEQLNNEGISLEEALNVVKEAFQDNSMFISHNAEFDFSIINRDAEKLGISINIENFFCTMKKSENFCKILSSKKNQYKWPKLSELAEKLKIEYDSSRLHNSEYDIMILKDCFFIGKQEGVF